jgi:hypothetical protein
MNKSTTPSASRSDVGTTTSQSKNSTMRRYPSSDRSRGLLDIPRSLTPGAIGAKAGQKDPTTRQSTRKCVRWAPPRVPELGRQWDVLGDRTAGNRRGDLPRLVAVRKASRGRLVGHDARVADRVDETRANDGEWRERTIRRRRNGRRNLRRDRVTDERADGIHDLLGAQSHQAAGYERRGHAIFVARPALPTSHRGQRRCRTLLPGRPSLHWSCRSTPHHRRTLHDDARFDAPTRRRTRPRRESARARRDQTCHFAARDCSSLQR